MITRSKAKPGWLSRVANVFKIFIAHKDIKNCYYNVSSVIGLYRNTKPLEASSIIGFLSYDRLEIVVIINP